MERCWKPVGILDETDSSRVMLVRADLAGGRRDCALKRIDKAKTRQPAAMYVNECRVLASLQGKHDGIVRLLGVYEDQGVLELLFEYAELGSLRHLMEHGDLSQGLVDLWADVARAVAFLHGCRVAHLDLKTDNVLVFEPRQAKLTDFGTALRVAPKQLVTGNFGTEGFKAPEVGSGGGFDPFPADIFALGRVLLEMLRKDGELRPLSWLVDQMTSAAAKDRPPIQTVTMVSESD